MTRVSRSGCLPESSCASARTWPSAARPSSNVAIPAASSELIDRAVASLEDDFLTVETVSEGLKDAYLKDDDEARSCIVRAAELGVINSCDILPVFHEFKSPSHEEFAEPTRWSLLNSITEIVKKYSPQRVDHSYLALNRAFGLDGRQAAIFA